MPIFPPASRVPQKMSLLPPACSTPVIAGARHCVALPTWVVLTQAVSVLVEPRTGARLLVTLTADSLAVCVGTPSPLNDNAAAPILPGTTHCGSGVPCSVPLLPPAE